MKGLSLIIPAHNAGKVIENSLKNYHKIFSKEFKNLEIVVVCNACKDNTEIICKSLKDTIPLKIISIPNRGKGNALIKGFKNAKYSTMGFLDADNPFDLVKITKLINKLQNNDVAIVSKYIRGEKKKQEYLLRRFISMGGGLFSRVTLGLNFRDTQGGAKFFKKEVWEKIKNPPFICIGFDWDMEFLYKAKKEKFKIVEVYIPVNPEKLSTVSLKYLPGMVFRLLKLRLK